MPMMITIKITKAVSKHLDKIARKRKIDSGILASIAIEDFCNMEDKRRNKLIRKQRDEIIEEE